MINGFGVNSAYTPAWVVRAVVVAVAVAVPVTTAPTRIIPASAYGNASAVISLSQTQTVAAYASANSETSKFVLAAQIYSGRVLAAANAAGTAIVYRAVLANAAGDASATGSALPNSKLGTASAVAAASVNICSAHRIRPAASYRLAELTAQPAAGEATRYSPVTGSAGATGRGEASYRQAGQTYFRHDGYVLGAQAVCLGLVGQDKTKIIATLGAFDFGNGTGVSKAFMRQPGASIATGNCSVNNLIGARAHAARVTATATATATALPLKTRLATATASANADHIRTLVVQRHAAHAAGVSDAAVISVVAKRRTFGVSVAQALASSATITPGRQYFDAPTALCSGTASSLPSKVLTRAVGVSLATGTAVYASQRYASALGASGAAKASTFVRIATTARSSAQAFALSIILNTRSSNPAPLERQMVVSGEDGRAMQVAFENRIMVVPS